MNGRITLGPPADGRSAEVTAFVPATVANLGPGFDVLGLAIQGAGDRVTARLVEEPGVRIVKISGDQGKLPYSTEKNTAGVAAVETLRTAGVEAGIELEVFKGLPIGSGLGSSAATAGAAAFAVNLLIGSPLRKTELIEPCLEAEAAIAGRHADNVAPAVLGGLILVRSVDPLDLVRLPVPEGLQVVVVTPDFELLTRDARDALPEKVSRSSWVNTSANLSAFVSACYSGDLGLLARAIDDPIVTPARAALIPGGATVIQAALAAGAIGSSISGSGPSIFAFCHSAVSAAKVQEAMQGAFEEAGLASSAILSPANCSGARQV